MLVTSTREMRYYKDKVLVQVLGFASFFALKGCRQNHNSRTSAKFLLPKGSVSSLVNGRIVTNLRRSIKCKPHVSIGISIEEVDFYLLFSNQKCKENAH